MLTCTTYGSASLSEVTTSEDASLSDATEVAASLEASVSGAMVIETIQANERHGDLAAPAIRDKGILRRIPLTSSEGFKTARRFRRYKKITPMMGENRPSKDPREKEVTQTSELISPIPGRFDCVKLDRYLGEAISRLVGKADIPGSLPVDGLDFPDRGHCKTELLAERQHN